MVAQQIAALDGTINGLLVSENVLLHNFFVAFDWTVAAFIIFALVYYFAKKKFLAFSQVLFGSALLYVIVEILKRVVLRPRPDGSDSFAFPSRHAALAFFLALVLPVNIRYRIMLAIWAVLIGFSRLLVGQHWFTDVLIGAVFGILTAYLLKQEIIENRIKKLLQRIGR